MPDEDIDLHKAIIYATEVWKVKIISLSIGFRKAFLDDEDKTIVRNAIGYATNKKVLIFAAASNDGNRDRILFPASEPEPFCINSSNGNGHASEFNPPHQEQDENFSILGEGVSSTWLQKPDDVQFDGRVKPTWEVRGGTSVATPIAASVAAIIIHFGRQWEPVGHEKLETRRGIRCILKSMAPKKNTEKFYDVVPWHGLFELPNIVKDPIGAAKERIENELDAAC
jgi:subtilisin family serine protease